MSCTQHACTAKVARQEWHDFWGNTDAAMKQRWIKQQADMPNSRHVIALTLLPPPNNAFTRTTPLEPLCCSLYNEMQR